MPGKPLVPRELMQFFRQSREIQRYFDELGRNTDGFANKVVGGTEDNIVTLKADGDIQDSGESIDTLRARSYFYGRNR